MNVLSFLWSQCSTAGLFVDVKVVAWASEERYSRIKNDERFHAQAIQAVLNETGIQSQDIDLIALPGLMWSPQYVLSRRHSFGVRICPRCTAPWKELPM